MSANDVNSIANDMVASCPYGFPNQGGINKSPALAFVRKQCRSEVGNAARETNLGAMFIKQNTGRKKIGCLCQSCTGKPRYVAYAYIV